MGTTNYLGPVGYAYDSIAGNDTGRITDYLDPGDILGKKAADDVLGAGKEAQAQLKALSEQAWMRQMQGLQLALGSMNNYNGVLSNLYGVPTNQYDPRNMGGIQGPYQGGEQMPFTGTPSGLPAPPSHTPHAADATAPPEVRGYPPGSPEYEAARAAQTRAAQAAGKGQPPASPTGPTPYDVFINGGV